MSWANDYIKIPFVDRGRTREGSDCWGLARLIYADKLGITLPTLDFYENTKDRKTMNEIIQEERTLWEAVPKGQEKEFDIAIFNMVGVPMHVGIVVRPDYMVHCQHGLGTVFENYKGHRWVNRLEGFCRYADSTDKSATFQPPS